MGTLSGSLLRGDLFAPIPVGDPGIGAQVRTLRAEPIESPVPDAEPAPIEEAAR